MAILGQSLTAPELGWTRYDDIDPSIKHSLTERSSYGAPYNGTQAVLNKDSSKMEFSFTGTSIRIMGLIYPGWSTSVGIKIDGVIESFSSHGSVTVSQALLYEKIDLQDTIHMVEIYRLDPFINNEQIGIDSIDILSGERLLRPDEVADVRELVVGKRVRCNYSAITGKSGYFSGIGKETGALIPASANISSPNGDFYLIMVEELNGKMLLVADRNIQSNISWDELNSAGIASGKGLPLQSILANNKIKAITSNVPWFNKDYVGEKSIDGLDTTYAALANNVLASNDFRYEFNEPIKLFRLSLHSFFQGGFESLGLFNVYGANKADYSDKVIIGTFTHENIDKPLVYDIDNDTLFSHIIIEVRSFSGSNGSNNTMIKEIQFYTKLPEEIETISVRLMSGGTSISDKDNEWDKYIVNSTLDGLITPGDNTVWNWDITNIRSWTSTTLSSSSAQRVMRGNGTGGAAPSGISAYVGITSSFFDAPRTFRPIVELTVPDKNTGPGPGPGGKGLGTQLFRKESGYLFTDDFNTINSMWTISPVGSYSIMDRPGHLRLKHHVSQDTLILSDIPSDIFAVEVHADYTPTEVGDEGGILLWNNSKDKVEFVENVDSTVTGTQKSWMVLKEGKECKFFSSEGLGYNFVDNAIIEANKFGVILKRGAGTQFVNMDVDRIIATKGNKITVMNVPPGMSVRLTDTSGVILAEDVVNSGSAIRLTLPSLEVDGTLSIIDDLGVLSSKVDAKFYGGDIYSIGTSIEVRIDESELSRVSHTDLGNMTSGVLEVLMNVYNPSDIVCRNIDLSIEQYTNKFGWEWADLSVDVSGVPGVYSDTINIPTLQPKETIYFWVKVTKGVNYIGTEPIQFNVHMKHL